MKKIAIALSFISLSLFSCGDKPPDFIIPDDMLVKILTEGEWSVTDYKEGSTDKTTDFYGWRFKFHSTNVVEAKFNTVVTYSGSWSGNQQSMTFSATFTNPNPPVTLVNGTWTVTQPGTRIVVATQVVNGVTNTMKLYRE